MQWEAVDGRNKGFLKKQEGIYSKFVGRHGDSRRQLGHVM